MVEINNTTRTKMDEALVRRILSRLQEQFRLTKKDISVAFVGEVTMRRLNKQTRGNDRVTDILSLEGDDNELGELILCFSKIKKQGPQFGQTPKQELIFILVHGFLHLLGDDDSTESGRLAMIAKGENLIKKLKLK